MTGTTDFLVRFWGVRGSVPVPGPDTVRYGGNTSCLEVRCGDHLLIFDAGTGLRPLGLQLAEQGAIDAELLLTHTHIDHLNGMPFFAPAFNPASRIRVWAGHLPPGVSVRGVLGQMMAPPLFPVPPDVFRAGIEFAEFRAGETLHPREDVSIRTAPLDHPDGATGYRIEFGGRAICYVTDTNHRPGRPNAAIIDLIRGAQVVVYDAMFTEAEHPAFAEWGHSTWNEGARLCDAAGAGTLVLFHHDPARGDDALDEIGREAAAARPGTLVAREGLTLRV